MVFDFMIENLIIICIAFIMSLEVISWIIPFFNDLTESHIDVNICYQSQFLADHVICGIIAFICHTDLFCK